MSKIYKKYMRGLRLRLKRLAQHTRLKSLLGSNLAFLAITTSTLSPISMVSTGLENASVEAEQTVIRLEAPVETIVTSRYPVDKVAINQGYWTFHPGLDLEGVTGEAVYPIKNGRVVALQFKKYPYGNAIIVDHGGGLTSLYAHLSKIEVKSGQIVDMDTKIGEIGSTGRSTGSHLHFEIRESGYPVNPYTVLGKT